MSRNDPSDNVPRFKLEGRKFNFGVGTAFLFLINYRGCFSARGGELPIIPNTCPVPWIPCA